MTTWKGKSSMLAQSEVIEFKRLVLEAYGIRLTDKEAMDQGSRLICLFELLIREEKEKRITTINSYQKVGK